MLIFDDLLQGRASVRSRNAAEAGQRKQKGGAHESRNRVLRVASRAPEVMVKVSGYSKGVKHLRAHLEYITRNGDVPGETDRGDQILSRTDVRYLHSEWASDLGRRQEGKTRDAAHVVLSMPPGHDPRAVYDTVRAFAADVFDNHQYLTVLHTDEKHPHVHIAVKALGYDGRRLHIKKGDPQKWREVWAGKLREHGIEAEATPRAVRGVVRKASRQNQIHMRRAGRMPETDKQRMRDALSDKPANRPWEERIARRQQAIRATWMKIAGELQQSETMEDQRSAQHILRFTSLMPAVKTEREAMCDLAQRQRSQDRDAGREPDDFGRE